MAKSLIWPWETLHEGHVMDVTRPCLDMDVTLHSHNWATAQMIQRPSLLHLQPLYVTCFRPFKTFYHRAITKTVVQTLSAPVLKRRFIAIYKNSRNRCINSSNIEAGFEVTGIWPVQPSRVLNELLQPEAAQQPEMPPPTQPGRHSWTSSLRRDISQATARENQQLTLDEMCSELQLSTSMAHVRIWVAQRRSGPLYGSLRYMGALP